jgi:hypothetical protein
MKDNQLIVTPDNWNNVGGPSSSIASKTNGYPMHFFYGPENSP